MNSLLISSINATCKHRPFNTLVITSHLVLYWQLLIDACRLCLLQILSQLFASQQIHLGSTAAVTAWIWFSNCGSLQFIFQINNNCVFSEHKHFSEIVETININWISKQIDKMHAHVLLQFSIMMFFFVNPEDVARQFQLVYSHLKPTSSINRVHILFKWLLSHTLSIWCFVFNFTSDPLFYLRTFFATHRG